MIAIVTDSTAYLTHEEAAQLGVVIVPMSYSYSANQSFSEGCIEADDFAERQVAEHIEQMHTSQATLLGFQNTFRMLRRGGYDILCLTISSRLSGTYANAMLAAREFGSQNVAVVDSLTTCSGLYLLIREARARIRAGDRLSSVARQIEKLRSRVRICFSVDDMAPLRRSGRLGNVRMSISTVLNIKPILAIHDGAVISTGIARGRVDQMAKLSTFCKDTRGPLIIDSFLADDVPAKLSVKLARADREIERRRIGPVLGAHLGRGCVGVTYIEAE